MMAAALLFILAEYALEITSRSMMGAGLIEFVAEIVESFNGEDGQMNDARR